jgi:hypothetical protein
VPLLPTIIGLPLLGAGTIVTFVNVYTSFIRFPLHRWRGGTRNDFRWVSGFPLVGAGFMWLAALALIRQPVLMWTTVVVSLFDTGGPHWLAGTMIYMTLVRQRADGP